MTDKQLESVEGICIPVKDSVSQLLRCRYVTLLNAAFLVIIAANAFAEKLPIKSYNSTDGLAGDIVSSIVQDSRGFIWFCTPQGLSRFDGYRFVTYDTRHGLPSATVREILETRRGVYWVATSLGVSRFDPDSQSDRFTTHRVGATSFTNSIFGLFEDRSEQIWVETQDGLFKMRDVNGSISFEQVQLPLSKSSVVPAGAKLTISGIEQDRHGALWIASFDLGLWRLLPDGRVEHYGKQNGLRHLGIRALLKDRDDRLWLAVASDGLCQLIENPRPDASIIARRFTTADGLADTFINSLYQTSNGRIWISTSHSGVSVFDGESFRNYSSGRGLPTSRTTTFCEDRDGNLWIGSLIGALRIPKQGFTTYGTDDGLASLQIQSVIETPEGEIWVVTGRHGTFPLNFFDGSKFTPIIPLMPDAVATIPGWGWNQFHLRDSRGAWWIPTGTGLLRYPPVKHSRGMAHTRPIAFYQAKDGLAVDEVFRLFEDSRGDIWIGTLQSDVGGVTRWERTTEKFHNHPDLARLAPMSFCEDQSGSVWMGFWDGGIARYDHGKVTRMNSSDGIPNGRIRDLHVDRAGRLWIASSRGGIGRIDHPAADRPVCVTISSAHGLAVDDAWCITEDKSGRIYVGTGRGVDRIDPSSGRIKHYTTSDGLPINNVQSALCDRDGNLWFGTPNGLSRFVPAIAEPQLQPTVLISRLWIGGVEQRISELGAATIPILELTSDRDDVQIESLGLSFATGETVRYQYRLDGADNDWNAPTEQRTVNYANLQPGKYRFQVKAVRADGAVSDAPASFAFTILPPIWQRWWFTSLAAISLLTIAYLLYRARVARLLELERVRTRIASDLHDDIGASLSQIAIVSEVVGRQVADGDTRVARNLQLIARTSREAVDSMSDIVWAINPEQDSLPNLVRRMRRFSSEVLPAKSIEFRFRASTEEIKLRADVRRQVFLIFKECINNIAKHAKCTDAEIELRVEGSWLWLEVSDNGHGLNESERSDGHGLTNMRRRAESLGGRLEVESNGSGTKVKLRVPY